MLRPYQIKAVQQIRDWYKVGSNRALLHMATGSGKTVIFSHILKSTAEKQKHCMMVVRGRHLVDQASQRLIRESVPHGVLMAGHKHYYPDEKIQICSIDTLIHRDLRPKADLIVIDEAHMATSKGYHGLISSYPDSYVLAVTATPYTEKPLKHIADTIVRPVTIKELIEQGYLVNARYFAPSQPNLKGVKVSSSTKDYVTEDLAQVMDQNILIGDIIEHWKKLGENRPTLCFAVNIAHSKHLADCFNNAGIPAQHCDADTSLEERKLAIGKLERGELKVLTNVGIFCTGVDIPFLSCLILARPTKSYSLHIQQLGRGTRPSDGKTNFIVLDHSSNVIKHGFITEEKEGFLDGKKIQEAQGIRTCKQCFMVYRGSHCPSCGPLNVEEIRKKSEIGFQQGELRELVENDEVLDFVNEVRKTQKEKGYKRGWIYHAIMRKYGSQVAEYFCPRRKVPFWVRMR